MATELPQPVHILAFGDLAPGATAGLPLRSATLIGSLPTLRALRTFALAQKGNYCPTYTDLTKRQAARARRRVQRSDSARAVQPAEHLIASAARAAGQALGVT